MSEQRPAAGHETRDERSPASSETPDERLDRNLIELLNELRVTGTGIQVLLAFLLVVPFDSGFKHLSEFDRIVYFVALLTLAASAALLIAPSVHHRVLFHCGERPFIIRIANHLAVAGMLLLAVGLVSIVILLSNVVVGETAAVIVGVSAGTSVPSLWFALPLSRRRRRRLEPR